MEPGYNKPDIYKSHVSFFISAWLVHWAAITMCMKCSEFYIDQQHAMLPEVGNIYNYKI